MTDSTPAARQISPTRATSTQRSVGFTGDSNHTIRVRGPIRVPGVPEGVERDEPGGDAKALQQIVQQV